jgi:hypothetical protein
MLISEFVRKIRHLFIMQRRRCYEEKKAKTDYVLTANPQKDCGL